MKKIIPYNLFTIALAISITAFTNVFAGNPKGEHTKEKTIHKTFTVLPNATLAIDNSYGNLDIITWNENRIDIVVTITTNGDKADKVQEKLNSITVDFEASKTLVSAETIFNKNESKSWWNWSDSNNVNMKINYVIKMPITNNVNLKNDYGNINLGKLEGKAKINCDYGKITTKELMADDNILNFDYTSGCYFEYIKSGTINADYSGFTLSKTNSAIIHADYTNSIIETAENINYNCDYGSVKINQANTIIGNGDYLTLIVGDLYKNISIEADYGSIKIKNLTEQAENVIIDSNYVGISIGHDPNYFFNFNINLDYASLSHHDGLQFTTKHRDSDSSENYYIGYYGSETSKNKIKISSEYGGVTINKN